MSLSYSGPTINNPHALLSRARAAELLTDSGYPICRATLSTMATRGGGPPYYKFGTRVLYRAGELFAWAESRLTPPRRSTSEADSNPVTAPALLR
jgi:hypothetical protein